MSCQFPVSEVAHASVVRRSGLILLESVPNGIDLSDVQHDLEKVRGLAAFSSMSNHIQVPGVHSVHELHIWRLNQQKTLASVHVVVSDPTVSNFLKTARTINQCFHAYGIHSATLQPEVLAEADISPVEGEKMPRCQVVCGTMCEALTCCG